MANGCVRVGRYLYRRIDAHVLSWNYWSVSAVQKLAVHYLKFRRAAMGVSKKVGVRIDVRKNTR